MAGGVASCGRAWSALDLALVPVHRLPDELDAINQGLVILMVLESVDEKVLE